MMYPREVEKLAVRNIRCPMCKAPRNGPCKEQSFRGVCLERSRRFLSSSAFLQNYPGSNLAVIWLSKEVTDDLLFELGNIPGEVYADMPWVQELKHRLQDWRASL